MKRFSIKLTRRWPRAEGARVSGGGSGAAVGGRSRWWLLLGKWARARLTADISGAAAAGSSTHAS